MGVIVGHSTITEGYVKCGHGKNAMHGLSQRTDKLSPELCRHEQY